MTAPTGSRGKAQYYVGQMLANSTTFQTWVEADDAAEAAGHVYEDALPPPASSAEGFTLAALNAYRPFAIVDTPQYQRQRDSSTGFTASGTVRVYLEQVTPADHVADPKELSHLWNNFLDGLIGDMDAMAVSGTSGYLIYDLLTVTELTGRGPPNAVPTEGDYQYATIEFQYSDSP